ncbi:acyltransferase [Niabella sp. 22666]|uniref:acyltransferase n=1 Tax=Niabella sp. 22666 TaxID=3453954 RepID=UPI003F85EFA8
MGRLFRVFLRIVCQIRSLYYSKFIDNKEGGRIVILDPFIKIKIIKGKNAKLNIKGKFRIIPHHGGNTPVRIEMHQNSHLDIDGDFVIGHGVRMILNENAYLRLGGRQNESDSGITSDTLIMVKRRVEVGKDFICAWGVYITDCDWHQIGTQPSQADVIIGDHVWIANNATVLKGTHIGDNSIIAGQSKLAGKKFPPASLLAGIPAQVVKSDVVWKRDME